MNARKANWNVMLVVFLLFIIVLIAAIANKQKLQREQKALENKKKESPDKNLFKTHRRSALGEFLYVDK